MRMRPAVGAHGEVGLGRQSAVFGGMALSVLFPILRLKVKGKVPLNDKVGYAEDC